MQSICPHRANINLSRQTLFSEPFLFSCFPANEWRLSRPLCPISPEREAEIRTTFRSNLLHLSVLLQKLTITNTLTCIFTHQQHPFHCQHHQSGTTSPQGECGATLDTGSWEQYSDNLDTIHQSVLAICNVLAIATAWPGCTVCLQSHQPLHSVCSRQAICTIVHHRIVSDCFPMEKNK